MSKIQKELLNVKNLATAMIKYCKNILGWVALSLLCFALLAIADIYLYPVLFTPAEKYFNNQKNGLWLGSRWYLGKASDAEIISISKLLSENRITYAFFHCRGINHLGELRIKKQSDSKKLISEIHSLAPNVKVIAWLGAVDNEVDISQPTIRQKMCREAKWLCSDCGFDGIQWDYEVCHDPDSNLIKLLQETKALIGTNKTLSVAVPFNLSQDFVSQLSEIADQIAMMAYDTYAFWSPRLYVNTVSSAVTSYSQAINSAKSASKLLVGIPSYEEDNPLHHGIAENIKMALRGVKQALQDPTCVPERVEGVSIYAEYTTSQAEWKAYQHDWLGLH